MRILKTFISITILVLLVIAIVSFVQTDNPTRQIKDYYHKYKLNKSLDEVQKPEEIYKVSSKVDIIKNPKIKNEIRLTALHKLDLLKVKTSQTKASTTASTTEKEHIPDQKEYTEVETKILRDIYSDMKQAMLDTKISSTAKDSALQELQRQMHNNGHENEFINKVLQNDEFSQLYLLNKIASLITEKKQEEAILYKQKLNDPDLINIAEIIINNTFKIKNSQDIQNTWLQNIINYSEQIKSSATNRQFNKSKNLTLKLKKYIKNLVENKIITQ